MIYTIEISFVLKIYKYFFEYKYTLIQIQVIF
jgi:hypothetical protein